MILKSIRTCFCIALFALAGIFGYSSCTFFNNSSAQEEIHFEGKTISKILERDTIIIGTSGDYRPLTFLEPGTGEYWGFGIEVAQEIAAKMGVKVKFVGTTWPTLTADVLADPQMFDFAIGGITITDARCASMLMSE